MLRRHISLLVLGWDARKRPFVSNRLRCVLDFRKYRVDYRCSSEGSNASGVGKTTLINRLLGGGGLRTLFECFQARRTAGFGVLSQFDPICHVVELSHQCFVFYISGNQLAESGKMTQENQSFKLVNDAFPNIGKSILLFWGHPDFHEFMEGLQQEKEGRNRVGFPPDVLKALFDLTSEHDETFPELAPHSTGIWALHSKAGALQSLR